MAIYERHDMLHSSGAAAAADTDSLYFEHDREPKHEFDDGSRRNRVWMSPRGDKRRGERTCPRTAPCTSLASSTSEFLHDVKLGLKVHGNLLRIDLLLRG